MSKFQSTITTIAALTSIFGAGAAGWKLAESQSEHPPSQIDQKLTELEKKLEEKLAAAPVPPQPAPVAPSLPSPPPVIVPPAAPLPPPETP